MTKAKASTEGAETQSVAEQAPETHTEPVTPPPTLQDIQEANKALTVPEPAQPGLPSAHQDHALNWMTEIQIKFDTFKAGHDALVAELEGKDNEYQATRQEKQVQFENDMAKLDENHQQVRESLQARIDNMLTGMEVARVAVGRYNELVKPITQNIRDDEQQASGQ